MQALADDIARQIAAQRQPKAQPGRLSAHLGTIADDVVVSRLVESVAGLSGKFTALPIPDGTEGAIGECEGVIVRVMRDYDFHADRVATRIDAATR